MDLNTLSADINAFAQSVLSLDPTTAFMVTTTLVSTTFAMTTLYLLWSYSNFKDDTNSELEKLRKQLYAMTSAAHNMGTRVQSVEKNMHSAINRQIDLESKYPELRAFERVDDLLDNGATTADLIAEGMNRPEAELFEKLHKAKKVVG